MSTVNAIIHDFPGTPSGTVIDRPTGELALLWQAYARALEIQDKMQRKIAKLEREARHRV